MQRSLTQHSFDTIPIGANFFFAENPPWGSLDDIWKKYSQYGACHVRSRDCYHVYPWKQTFLARDSMPTATVKDGISVYLNKTQINLPQKNFLAAGGQGSIYVKGSTAYKIYADMKTAIPRGKIKELSYLTNNRIIRPLDILEDEKGNYVGYTMQFIKNTMPLCQIIPKSFKDRNSIKPNTTLDLVRQLQEIMTFVHSKNMLMVDINDLNYLVNDTFKDLYAIDVDSYATPTYPATAIMDSIRDRHTKGFTKGSDYFSFAVTSFQTLIGLHPYRGSHERYEKLPIKDRMDKRMKDNVSVFHQGVSIPGACLSFDVIPPLLRDWYYHIFETNDREPPPGNYQSVVLPKTRIKNVKHSELKVSIVKKLDNNQIITRLYYFTGRMYEICDPHQFLCLSKNKQVISLKECGDSVEWGSIEGTSRGIINGVNHLFNVGSNIYGISGTTLVRLDFIDTAQHIIGGIKTIGHLSSNEIHQCLFQGCIIQNLLKRHTVFIINENQVNQVGLPELDGLTLLDAKLLNNVLVTMSVNRKEQTCYRHVFRFYPNFTYNVTITKDVDSNAGIMFTVSQHDIVIMKNEDNKLEIFHANPKHTNIKMIPLQDLEIDSIWTIGGDILFTQANSICKIAL